MKQSEKIIKRVISGIGIVLIWSQILYAQTTDTLIREAISTIARGEYRQAIDTLRKTTQADPSSAPAWYFLGLAYNRLGFYKDARNSLVEAGILGMRLPELDRELGIAFSGEGDYQKALEHLQNASPDDKEAAYMRGFVALKLGMVDQAKKDLEIAKDDPLFHEKSKKLLLQLSDVKKVPPTQKKANFYVTFGGAYTDNATLRPDEAISIPGESEKGRDYSLSWGVRGSYLLLDQENTQLDMFVDVYQTYYRELSHFDATDLSTGIEARYTIPEGVVWIRPTFLQRWLGWDSYLSSFVLPMGAEMTGPEIFGIQTALKKTYTYSHNNYHFGSTGKESLDGHSHRFTFGPKFSTPDQKINLNIGLLRDIREPKGTSMRYDAWGLLVGFNIWLLPQLNINTSYSYREPRYKNSNIRSLSGRKRRDSENVFSVSSSLWVWKNQEISFYYQFLDNRSNIPVFYEYCQNTYGLFLRYHF